MDDNVGSIQVSGSRVSNMNLDELWEALKKNCYDLSTGSCLKIGMVMKEFARILVVNLSFLRIVDEIAFLHS